MRLAIVSCSLNPNSRSRVLCQFARSKAEAIDGAEVDYIDLREMPLPACDGAAAYGEANSIEVKARLAQAEGILLGVPIYNYDVNSAAKNLVELTGRDVWTGKVAGFACAAGGNSSYMSVMAFANSLMLDFRTLIVPRFVYATGVDVVDGQIVTDMVAQRTEELVLELARLTSAACQIS